MSALRCRAPNTCWVSTRRPALGQCQPYRQLHWRQQQELQPPQQRWLSTKAADGLAEYTGPAGQDSAELFDVFLAPSPASLASRFISREDLVTRRTATAAARAACHAEGIWHRSVHVCVLSITTYWHVAVGVGRQRVAFAAVCLSICLAGWLAALQVGRESSHQRGLAAAAIGPQRHLPKLLGRFCRWSYHRR
jgi:hypothetical protein